VRQFGFFALPLGALGDHPIRLAGDGDLEEEGGR